MQITPNKVVALTYVLREDSAEGAHIEEANEQQPLVFIYGIGQMLEDFETNLADKKVGDTFAFGIESERAYGPSFAEMVVDMPVTVFDGFEDVLQVGNFVPMSDGDGNQMNGQVREIKGDTVIVDFNHPMAGINLYFTGTILSVREAEAEELSHGHVHGDGGVHHS